MPVETEMAKPFRQLREIITDTFLTTLAYALKGITMNEHMARNGRLPVRDDGQGILRSGREWASGCHYFTRQAISQFVHGGGWQAP